MDDPEIATSADAEQSDPSATRTVRMVLLELRLRAFEAMRPAPARDARELRRRRARS